MAVVGLLLVLLRRASTEEGRTVERVGVDAGRDEGPGELAVSLWGVPGVIGRR